MRDLVIVPAWRRPGFLWACLERLTLADNGTAHYVISVDREADLLNSLAIEPMIDKLGAARVQIVQRNHRWTGNSYNILAALLDATKTDFDLVHIVEEDVFVAVDHFETHHAGHEEYPGQFAVSTCANQNFTGDVPNSRFYIHPSYQSLAVSMPQESLRRILPHIKPAYLNNPIAYCAQQFSLSDIPPENAEQDGLINRVREQSRLNTVYSSTPRAYHAGFTGYHRNGIPLEGTVEEQGRQLLAMTAEELNAHAPKEYRDHTVCDLD